MEVNKPGMKIIFYIIAIVFAVASAIHLYMDKDPNTNPDIPKTVASIQKDIDSLREEIAKYQLEKIEDAVIVNDENIVFDKSVTFDKVVNEKE